MVVKAANEAQVEALQTFQQALLSNQQSKLRTNSILRNDEWKAIDRAVIEIARERLNVAADLIGRGLVRNVGNLGVLQDQWETVSDMSDATIDMDADAAGEEDRVDFQTSSVPIPIVHKPFRISLRTLQASRNVGQSLDTRMATTATRKVRDALEDMILNGDDVQIGNNSIEGYTSHPDRVTGTLTAAWTNSSSRDILGDVESMLADADAANMFGPHNLYVSTSYFAELRGDYKPEAQRTFLDRIEAYDNINAVKPADRLSNADDVVLVQMTEDNVQLSRAQDIRTMEWMTQGGLHSHFLVMMAGAPRITPDAEGRLGIVHYTT